jgi:hypothetical protein
MQVHVSGGLRRVLHTVLEYGAQGTNEFVTTERVVKVRFGEGL